MTKAQRAARSMKGAFLICLLSVFGTAFSVCSKDAVAMQRRNVILITIDTIRADYLGCNGSTKVQTPNLDLLCRDGVNFVRARSPVPLTLPSHASILTGLYPPSHGVRDNGLFKLSEEHTTLAEVLQRAGYTTAAFVGSFVLDHRFGLEQGFDVYDDRAWSDPSTMETPEAERNAKAVLNAVSKWLNEEDTDGPFFLWIHFYDPHAPYVPPEPYRSRYRNDPYSGEIAYTDAQVRRLLDFLKKSGIDENTLVILSSDHGEELADHGGFEHCCTLYEEITHIPLIMKLPGVFILLLTVRITTPVLSTVVIPLSDASILQ